MKKLTLLLSVFILLSSCSQSTETISSVGTYLIHPLERGLAKTRLLQAQVKVTEYNNNLLSKIFTQNSSQQNFDYTKWYNQQREQLHKWQIEAQLNQIQFNQMMQEHSRIMEINRRNRQQYLDVVNQQRIPEDPRWWMGKHKYKR